MNIKWLRKAITSPLTWFIAAGLAVGRYGWMLEVSGIRWAALAMAIALISIGIGLESYVRAAQIEGQMKETNTRLEQIIDSLEEMKRKQDEQSSSSSMIIPTLETFTKFYLDYLDKQKSTGEEQINTNNAEDE